MRVDLVLKFDGNLCGVVKWILLFCCVCFPEIPVAGESRSSLIVITGEVKDADGEPLPGVTVVLKGTSLGCATGTDGKFRLEIPEQKEMVLLFRFVGMKNQEVTVTSTRHIRVTMVKDMKELDDVIVTGYYTQAKNAFTGEITRIKGEDLLRVSPTNLLQALAILTPGLRIVENNEAGSDPNVVPEILIRGASSIMTKGQEGVNAPLIMLDGVEISVEDLYDLDIYDIEQVLVLKDASAAVLYGEKAANGVILVERVRGKSDKPRFSYNFTPMFSFPDLTSLRLCDAEEKLELERLAGLYDRVDGSLDPAYDYKLENIRRGVNTDWATKPLRNAFTHSHSATMTGRGGGIEYKVTGRFSDTYGVMKGDYRRNYGVNVSLSYRFARDVVATYQLAYTMTEGKNSPYGSFAQYTRLNPYNPVYDGDGEYIRNYYFDPVNRTMERQVNPLYNATLASFSKSQNKAVTNYLSLRWDMNETLFITGNVSVRQGDTWNKVYVSSEDASFTLQEIPQNKKGTYTAYSTETTDWAGKLVLNYRLPLNDAGTTVLSLSAGTDIGKDKSSSMQVKAEGFMKDKMTDIKFASQYATTRPVGGEKESAEVGFFVNGSLDLLGRYFVNASYKTAGSSKFGSKHRFAPVWSVGIGWNLHKEGFMNFDWLNVLRLRFSVGSTANVTFTPYQALTTYLYDSDLIHYGGMGAVPITMGNPDMKWQVTRKYNWGLTATFWKERVNVEASYYVNKTKDALMPLTLPSSVGVSSVLVNMGKLQNSGYEFSISAQVVKRNNLLWMVMVNGSHVFDKLTSISDALKAENMAAYYGVKPQPMFVEGGSQFGIYAMRSAGIDPASGQEVYIKKNGNYTFTYDKNERVEVGNTNPMLEGSLFTSLSYRGFTLNVTAAYKFGGDIYNTTLANKVEYIDPYGNVDRRAFTERWKKPGDLVRFLGIPENVSDENRYSERFVERDNTFAITSIMLNYEFKSGYLRKIGIKRLNLGIGVADIARFSSVKQERGTEYPFQRSFHITFRPTF
ncbi:MAG: SusC/RagA family TonB-linked outer membrane protein [Butyricimonas synergistica]|nr:MAG: SusC/RagA family TonB-linked outer membrane protein [Butyricimonas synergistica]